MKRSPMPRRKKGLRRAPAVRRDTVEGRTSPEVELIREAVFRRDGQCRLMNPGVAGWAGACFGLPLTPHHLRKAGQGGAYSMSNLLTLCAGHNDLIEVLPRLDMEAAGLVIPRSMDLAAATVRAWALLQMVGIVTYWWDGTPDHRDSPYALADSWGRP